MKLSMALARSLREHGVETLFGVMGDANLNLIHDFVAEGGRYVSASHEGGATLMALGEGTQTGSVGVATVTHGAISNALTAIADGARGRQPVLIVAGDTAHEDKHHLQNLPHRDLVVAAGGGFEELRTPQSLAADVATALRRARVERRPIVLNVPVDLMPRDCEYAFEPFAFPDLEGATPSPGALNHALGIIASAQRPLVLAGRGAAAGDGRKALLRLAERIGAPLATTVKGKDLFRGEPFALGFFGNLATPVGLETIARADCIVAFGAGLNRKTTDNGDLLVGKRVVHVDINADRIGAISAVDCALVGDVAATADIICSWLDEAELSPSSFASAALADRIAAEVPELPAPGAAGVVDIRTALRVIEGAVPAERTLTIDGGRFWFESIKNLTVAVPTNYVHTLNIGSIGIGMGLAIGAGTARPDAPSLLVVGDGSFMLGGLQEFNTAVRHRVDLITVILNDGAYGAEHIQLRQQGLDPGLSTFAWPDFASVAEALGGVGYTVDCDADLAGVAPLIAERERPVLIDVRLDPDRVPMPAVH